MDRAVVTSIFRCIVRHARYIGDAGLSDNLSELKRRLRGAQPTKDKRVLSKRIKSLYAVEQSLRDIGAHRLSIPQFRVIWALSDKNNDVNALVERNQGGRRQLWLQQEARRFDAYNAAPLRGSEQFASIDQRAKFMDVAHRFAQKFNCSPDNPVVSTVFAPYWKATCRTRVPLIRPRPVEIRSVKRSSGTLSLLRVRGIQLRAKGLRRYIENVDKDRYSTLSQLDFDIWLARQYMLDPLDGEDMSDWIDTLVAERRRQRRELTQLSLKLEVHRRILTRRRAELERDWEWRYRRRIHEIERMAALKPKPLLTLDTL